MARDGIAWHDIGDDVKRPIDTQNFSLFDINTLYIQVSSTSFSQVPIASKDREYAFVIYRALKNKGSCVKGRKPGLPFHLCVLLSSLPPLK
jgi:hypothetical protein